MESPVTAINLQDWTEHDNIAEEIDSESLTKIGQILAAAIAADDLRRGRP